MAGMSLRLASGRSPVAAARLAGRTPLVEGRHVALLGRRSAPGCGPDALSESAILDLPDIDLMAKAVGNVAAASLTRLTSPKVKGFWIHLDVDVLNPTVMPAVASPEPGGPMLDELANILRPLVGHPRALGLSVANYDPALDADRSCARKMVGLLETLLGPGDSRPQ
jgi:arginase